jgi:hypothetical protein
MGITKGCASRWTNPNDERHQPDFVNLIDELATYSQCWWERTGRSCLTWDKFQATVYNKQMAGRFPDDWRESSRQEDKAPVVINVNKHFPENVDG